MSDIFAILLQTFRLCVSTVIAFPPFKCHCGERVKVSAECVTISNCVWTCVQILLFAVFFLGFCLWLCLSLLFPGFCFFVFQFMSSWNHLCQCLCEFLFSLWLSVYDTIFLRWLFSVCFVSWLDSTNLSSIGWRAQTNKVLKAGKVALFFLRNANFWWETLAFSLILIDSSFLLLPILTPLQKLLSIPVFSYRIQRTTNIQNIFYIQRLCWVGQVYLNRALLFAHRLKVLIILLSTPIVLNENLTQWGHDWLWHSKKKHCWHQIVENVKRVSVEKNFFLCDATWSYTLTALDTSTLIWWNARKNILT